MEAIHFIAPQATITLDDIGLVGERNIISTPALRGLLNLPRALAKFPASTSISFFSKPQFSAVLSFFLTSRPRRHPIQLQPLTARSVVLLEHCGEFLGLTPLAAAQHQPPHIAAHLFFLLLLAQESDTHGHRGGSGQHQVSA